MTKEEAERLLDVANNNSNRLTVIKKKLEYLRSCTEDENVKDQIQEILEYFVKYFGNDDEIKKWLLEENKYCQQREMKVFTVQKAFEKYITTNLFLNKEGKINIYGEVNGLFTFTNMISIYQLKEPLNISEYILSRQTAYSSLKYRSREANSKEFEGWINSFEKIMFNNKLFVDSEMKQYDKDIVTFEKGAINHRFASKQIRYMYKFLGDRPEIYISEKEPLVYGESEKGKGYVFSLRK